MKLPQSLTMKPTAHGSGAKGLAFYTYEDAEGVGIICDARRAAWNQTFVETYRFRWLPDAVFPTLKALLDVLHTLPDKAVDAERAKWPVLREDMTERDRDGSCWMHTDRNATHQAYAQTCWIASAGAFAPLCAECVEAAKTDPGVIVRASEKRRADCAERRQA